jgi:hypothetical protein
LMHSTLALRSDYGLKPEVAQKGFSAAAASE